MTVALTATCSVLIRKEPLDINLRLFYKPFTGSLEDDKSLKESQWQVADFRYGGVVPSDRK
jgi:hypothetical protein